MQVLRHLIYVARKRMADFEHLQLEIGLEFVCWSFTEHYNFSKGSSEPKEDAQVIRVWGRLPHE